MKNTIKLKKYMRFLRLYVNGVLNKIDKELNPEINIIRFIKTEKGYNFKLLPEYHKMNIEFNIETDLNDDKFLNSGNCLLYVNRIFSEYDSEKNLKAYYTKCCSVSDSVFLIRLSIDIKAYNNHLNLNKLKYSSFLYVNILQIINEIGEQNKLVCSDKDYTSLDYKETIRKSTRQFISECLNVSTITNVFNQINNVSSLYYENSVSTGKIVFVNKKFIKEEHPNIEKILILKQKVFLKNKRLIRKLLEISNSGIALLSDGKYVYGICRIIGNFDTEREDIFVVEYFGVYSWEFIYAKQKLFKVDYEDIYLPQNKITYSQFKRRISELFIDIKSSKIAKLYSVMLEALNQNKGTIIIISENAKSETDRLKSQAFRVEAKEMTPSIVKEITSIDGAVLIDTNCNCHGIGVILDGMATNNGDTSRGARYNSAIRYVETIKNRENYSDCLAIVISEDGYVDIISKYTLYYLGGV
jgi:DNA integrity scanning protein DisA with diadenylate cyclase activity